MSNNDGHDDTGEHVTPEASGQGANEYEDPLVGKVLENRYEVIGPVGEGGMAMVYRAKDTKTNRDVAVKVLNAHASRDSSILTRFESEAEIIAKLSHPNTLTMFDFGRTNEGQLFLVIEFVNGGDLEDLLENGPLEQAHLMRILKQVFEALHEAHLEDIIHRDLKPGNIMLASVGGTQVPKIVDFGIAKVLTGSNQTATGRVIGTPAYMSPEQIRGDQLTPASDLYSLGVVAYECLTGELPFKGEAAHSIMLKHLQEPPPLITELPQSTEVDPQVEAFVLSLLNKEPADRPTSALVARDQVEALERALLTGTQSMVSTRGKPAPTAVGQARPQIPGGSDTSSENFAGAMPTTEGTPPKAGGGSMKWIAIAVVLLAGAGFAFTQLSGEKDKPLAVSQTKAEVKNTLMDFGEDGLSLSTGYDKAKPRPKKKKRKKSSKGKLTKQSLKAAIKDSEAEMNNCHEQAVLAGAARQGKLLVEFTIGPDGKVKAAKVVDNGLKSKEAEACLLEQLNNMEFPAPESGEQTVKMPINFDMPEEKQAENPKAEVAKPEAPKPEKAKPAPEKPKVTAKKIKKAKKPKRTKKVKKVEKPKKIEKLALPKPKPKPKAKPKRKAKADSFSGQGAGDGFSTGGGSDF